MSEVWGLGCGAPGLGNFRSWRVWLQSCTVWSFRLSGPEPKDLVTRFQVRPDRGRQDLHDVRRQRRGILEQGSPLGYAFPDWLEEDHIRNIFRGFLKGHPREGLASAQAASSR